MSDSRDVSGVRHTYHQGGYHRDRSGRFASAGLAAGGFTAAGGAGTLAGIAHAERKRVGAAGDRLAGAYNAARDTQSKNQIRRHLVGLAGEERALGRGVKVLGATAAASTAAGAAGLYLHGRHHDVSKSILERAKHKLDSIDITPKQSRMAGTFGQIGAGTGVIAGASTGAVIGAATKHPAQGAGIGGALGGAVGGAGGAAAGLYAGRPRKKQKKLTGTAPTTLAKAYDKTKAGAAGAVTGVGASAVLGTGARSSAARLHAESFSPVKQKVNPAAPRPATRTRTLAEFKAMQSRSRMMQDTADFHGSLKGKAVMAGAGAAAGLAIHRHRAKKKAALNAAVVPVAKVSDETKTKMARAGLVGAQIADVAAIKSAWHETSTATKEGTGIKSALSYGAKKAALPIVAGGLVASIGAERVMHSQQKKLKAAQTAGLKPKRTTNP